MKFILLIFLSFNCVIASTSVDEEKELCKAIIDNNIKKLVNQCSKYLEKYEVFDIVNKKFINLDDSPEKKDFFKKYVLEYRKISSYAEKTNKSIDKYILNYQSHDISYINNINIIFSNKNYTPSERLMRKLINKDVSDVNFSKNILDKLKLFKSMIAENEKMQKEQKIVKPHKSVLTPSRKKIQTVTELDNGLTASQKGAVSSARKYLNFMGFSKKGLIQQLSSSYGDNYSVTDATEAVNSLNINWNEQAVKSAKKYLKFMSFSCKGLIRQLSSKAGDKYTIQQASYGAKQVGLCR